MKVYIKQIYWLGYASILQQAMYTVYIVILNAILAGFSDSAVTVLGLYYKMQTFFFIPLGAMQTCIVPVISFNYAARKPERCKSTMKVSALFGMGMMFLGALVFEFFPVQMVRVFTPDPQVAEIARVGFRFVGGSFLPQVLALLDRARQEGLDLSCDVYPYTAGSTQLLHILPPEFLAGGMEAIVRRLGDPDQRRQLARRIESGDGFDDIAKLAGWDGIFLTSLHCPEDHPYQGMSLARIAALTGQDPLTCCCDLLVRERGEITMIDFMADEEDIAAILRDPFSNLISDSTYPTEGQPHPRVYGTFVHLLTRFVLQRGDLTPEAAIHKMTGRPAAVLGMPDRGVLAPGAQADINIFAPEDLREPGTYQDPCRMAEGMDTVLVAGVPVIDGGVYTGALAGRIVRR